MLELETFLHAHNISFAPILIDLSSTTQLFQFGQYTDEVYYEGAIDWINEVNSAIGQPDHLIFESFARPQYSDTNLISMITPINLPENDISVFSHTRLINEGLAIFNPPPHSCCCVNRIGNANGLGGDEPTIGDISVIIDAKFITSTCDGVLDCLGEADANQSGGSYPTCDDITIGDISTLIDYLFITGSSLGLAECL